MQRVTRITAFRKPCFIHGQCSADNMLLTRFEKYLQENELVRQSDTLVLAVSGGRDSMALLDLFYRIMASWNLKLVIVHVNHQLRGHAADRDEQFVIARAQCMGIRIFSYRVDVKTLAKAQKFSTEAAARELRFQCLYHCLNRIQGTRIALGHHMNDQAETVLMHLMRGSGLKGLGGIRPRQKKIIHPLLYFSRDELSAYCRSRRLQYVEDHSNQSPVYIRNRVRHQVLPVLTSVFGDSLFRTVMRSSQYLREVETFLARETEKPFLASVHVSENEIILDIVPFLHYFKAIQKSILFRILEQFGCRMTYQTIQRLMALAHGKSDGKVELQQGKYAYRFGNSIYFVTDFLRPAALRIAPDRVYWLEHYHCHFCITQIDIASIRLSQNRTIEFADADACGNKLNLRTFMPGDWFVPLGMQGKKKIHDFFIDHHIPPHRRPIVPILTSQRGIVWILGHRLDERFKVTPKTKKVFKLRMIPMTEKRPA